MRDQNGQRNMVTIGEALAMALLTSLVVAWLMLHRYLSLTDR